MEEAVAIRDRLLTSFDRAAALPPGPRRQKLLTAVFVGGGFSGVEGFAEALSPATSLLRRYPELHREELRFHLVEASGRILPEVTDSPGRWVVRFLRRRGGEVHLSTQVESATGGRVVLSTGEAFDSELIVWTTGNATNPVVGRHTDLPVDERGFLVIRRDLRVGTDAEPVPGAWAAGDDAGIEDLTAVPGTRAVPNAQHAVRQGKLLARTIAATLRGQNLENYRHRSLGAVAVLGLGHGIFQYRRLVLKGPPAWLIHRGYHVLAVPGRERKVRVPAIWLTAGLFGRDIVSPASVQQPRTAFVNGGEPSENSLSSRRNP